MLDLLTSKTSECSLLGSWLPPLSKLVVALSSKQSFEEAHNKYMRMNLLNLDQNKLADVNKYLVEARTGLNEPMASKAASKDAGKIQPYKPNRYSEEDPLENVLDFVPADFQTLSTLL